MGIENIVQAKLIGVSRDAENDKAVILHLDRPLTDDELRYLHDAYRLVTESMVEAVQVLKGRSSSTLQ